MDNNKITELRGAMDIDLVSREDVDWKQDECPWNKEDNTTKHQCAIKDTSICKYFRGIKYPDKVLCTFSI
ncbi:MAG: hypothetical protein ABH811_02365 [archaeon]